MKKTAFILPIAIVLLFSLSCKGHTSKRNNRGFLFETNQEIISVPYLLHVRFAGLNGDGAQHAAIRALDFQVLLANSLYSQPLHSLDSGVNSRIQYDIDYDVEHAPTGTIQRIEQMIAQAAKRTHSELFEIEVTDIEAKLDQIVDDITAPPIGERDEHPNAVLVLSPDKQRVAELLRQRGFDVKDSFHYRYRYLGGSPTQQWIARGRYVIVDLTSGPCMRGIGESGEGIVSISIVPSLHFESKEETGDKRLVSAHFSSQLVALIVSAVRTVFVPDMRTAHAVEPFEKVVVPLIVLRNHREFDPLTVDPSSEYYINATAIHDQIHQLLMPHQEAVVLPVTHDLFDHRALSASVYRALRTDTIHSADKHGRFHATTVPFLDSHLLTEALRRTSDSLAGPLLRAAAAQAQRALTGDSNTGIKILPIYLLSLLRLPSQLMLDRTQLYVAHNDMVLVLQTEVNNASLPYWDEQGFVSVSLRSPHRHVVAGVAAALGGLVGPYERYSTIHQSVVQDLTWAAGAHPFGPYASSSSHGLSSAMLDSSKRNTILARASLAFRAISHAFDSVDALSEEYSLEAFGGDVETDQVTGRTTTTAAAAGTNKQQDTRSASTSMWSDLLHGDASSVHSRLPVLAVGVVDKLYRELKKLEADFWRLTDLMRARNLVDAQTLSASILTSARGLSLFTQSEIASAKSALKCCHVSRTTTSTSSTSIFSSSSIAHSDSLLWWETLAVLAVIAAIVAVLYLSTRTKGIKSKPVWSSRDL